MVVTCMRTSCGRWRVLIHADNTAELREVAGENLLVRGPLYLVGERLAALGVAGDDLIPD
jgi:hypothetical protein